MRQVFFIGLIIAVSLTPVYATSLSTDESSYQEGDSILLTGSVGFVDADQFISVQILNPSKSDFAQIDSFLPNSDGSFTRTYKAEGSKWNVDGLYTIKLFYNQENFQTTFEFDTRPAPEPQQEQPEIITEPVLSDPKQEPVTDQNPNMSLTEPHEQEQLSPTILRQEPKTHIPGFPSLEKSPQHYYDRYDNEKLYQDWFDSQFPGKSIQDVIGYQTTHVSEFPDDSKSPKYYLDRYDNEKLYQDWFDSQFPHQSMYGVLGFPEPASVPEWIKNNAGWWATGKINDDEFVSGLRFMIKNDIIVIGDIPKPISNAGKVPDWIRNNASWWALEKIPEEEFINGIKYLIANGIITVDMQ